MKEITRRLYTKPVMLGMAFLMGIALVVGLFVTSKSTAAPNSFPVAAGNDEFETAGDGSTFHNFAGSPIPANFFGTGSLAYDGQVILQGVPLGPGSNVDTIIQRTQAVGGPGGSTPIAMTAHSRGPYLRRDRGRSDVVWLPISSPAALMPGLLRSRAAQFAGPPARGRPGPARAGCRPGGSARRR